MFTGKQPIAQDQDGHYFIDVDSSAFHHILTYLRSGEISMMGISTETYDLAVKFGIKGFVEKAKNCKAVVAAEQRKKIRLWYPDYDEILLKVIEYIKIKLSTANTESIVVQLKAREDPKELPGEVPFFIHPAVEDPQCFFLFKLLEADLMLRNFYPRQVDQWQRSSNGQMWRVSFTFDVKDLLTPY